jgi:putative IMPACT (imprinted ancient) family translation regulator
VSERSESRPPTDERTVPAREGRGEVRERASRFFAYAIPAQTEEAALEALERLRREHHDATHLVFAWRIGSPASVSRRASDAGEPPGTAGKPILGAIESAGLSDVLIAVAREFGGKKLGTAGLVRAYRDAAQAALEDAGTKALYDTVAVTVTCPPARAGALHRLLDPPAIVLSEERWDARAGVTASRLLVRLSRVSALLAALDEARLSYESASS